MSGLLAQICGPNIDRVLFGGLFVLIAAAMWMTFFIVVLKKNFRRPRVERGFEVKPNTGEAPVPRDEEE